MTFYILDVEKSITPLLINTLITNRPPPLGQFSSKANSPTCYPIANGPKQNASASVPVANGSRAGRPIDYFRHEQFYALKFFKNTIAGSTPQLERSANEKDMLLFGSVHHEQKGYSRSASITRMYPTRTVIYKNDLLLATTLLEMASRKLLPNGSLASALVRIKRISYQRLERDTNALTPR